VAATAVNNSDEWGIWVLLYGVIGEVMGCITLSRLKYRFNEIFAELLLADVVVGL